MITKEYIEKLKTATELELQALEIEWPKTKAELDSVIEALATREHDYGTCVYAMSIAAVSAYYYMSSLLGTTGFQASCADMDFLMRTRCLKHGFMVVDYDKFMYPQYNVLMEVVEAQTSFLASKIAKDSAAEKLVKGGHPDVVAHWQNIVNGTI